MLKEMTRSRVIQAWFAAVTLVLVAAIAFGVSVGTGAFLLALSLVPPAIVFKLWPGPQAATAAEVLYGVDRRA